jgi:hypothetical protein
MALSLKEAPMSVRPVRLSAIVTDPTRHYARHAALLAGVSVVALFLANPAAVARPLGGATPSAAAMAAAQSTQQEAARAASQSSEALKRATLAMQASQQAARDAARAAAGASSIPNGLGAGGLQRPASPRRRPLYP